MRGALVAGALLTLAVPPVQARPPQRQEMPQVGTLARELADTAQRVERSIDTRRGGYDPREDRAVYQLRLLGTEAGWLARQALRHESNPERSEDDFRRLVQVYTATAASLDDLSVDRATEREFRRLAQSMDLLSDFYGGRERFWGGRGVRDGRMVTLPAGTTVPVALARELRSRDLRPGDAVAATVAADVRAGDRVVLPRGARAMLHVSEREQAGRIEGREQITLELAQVDLHGRSYPVESGRVTLVAEESRSRDARVIAGSAAVGAIIGAIADQGEGALTGGAIGAVAGTGVVLATKGKTVRLPAGQRIDFVLEESARVPSEPRLRDRDDRGISRRD